MDLHTDSPELYAARFQPLELAEAVAQLAEWDETACRVADYLLNAWTLAICLRPDDREGLDDLEYCLRLALEQAANLPDAWRARWQGYFDLVQARALLYADTDDILELLDRKHVKPILSGLLARGGECQQGDLRQALGLGQERSSQVLRQMENRGLITRRKQGRENLLTLTDLGRRHAPEADGQAPRFSGKDALAGGRLLSVDAYLKEAA